MTGALPEQIDIDSLVSHLQAAQESTTISHSDSTRLLRAAQNLVTRLEKPATRLVAIAKGPAPHAALRVAFNIKLFEAFDTETSTARDLAQRCGVDPVLMARIMRALLCIGIFDEVGEETYTHNLLSRPLMNPGARAMIRGMAETTDIMPKLPDYLASLDYRNPNDRHNSFFAFAHKTDLNMYEWLQAHPQQMKIFNDFQTANAQFNEGSVQRILESLMVSGDNIGTNAGQAEQDNNKVLFVDVGGGRGEALRKFRRNHPELRGRVIIEDLPKVIEGQEVEEGVEAIAHDFFTPQPVLGARIYFLRFILHNWPTSACRTILRHTISAMSHPSSKLVISDLLLPATNARPFETLMDIQMLAFGGMERTEGQWRELLEGKEEEEGGGRVGLKIVEFVKPEEGASVSECLIVCVLAGEGEGEPEGEETEGVSERLGPSSLASTESNPRR